MALETHSKIINLSNLRTGGFSPSRANNKKTTFSGGSFIGEATRSLLRKYILYPLSFILIYIPINKFLDASIGTSFSIIFRNLLFWKFAKDFTFPWLEVIKLILFIYNLRRYFLFHIYLSFLTRKFIRCSKGSKPYCS